MRSFFCVLSHSYGSISDQKLSPQAGKVDTNGVSGRKGNDSKLSSNFTVPPQSRLRLDSSPINGGALWCSINTAYSAVPLAERSFQRGYGGRQGA